MKQWDTKFVLRILPLDLGYTLTDMRQFVLHTHFVPVYDSVRTFPSYQISALYCQGWFNDDGKQGGHRGQVFCMFLTGHGFLSCLAQIYLMRPTTKETRLPQTTVLSCLVLSAWKWIVWFESGLEPSYKKVRWKAFDCSSPILNRVDHSHFHHTNSNSLEIAHDHQKAFMLFTSTSMPIYLLDLN